ncbi:hypothetical protein MANES_04G074641v8 [Manihot esculenta]|uniref:Uncharacterized protein n=1 Tax=Manihot esculenta TaxID=3983 RepID=A0ACB7HVA1_MANES|nr:hypothetical protein MANES_04G074641v8 [Manihot esculenta]
MLVPSWIWTVVQSLSLSLISLPPHMSPSAFSNNFFFFLLYFLISQSTFFFLFLHVFKLIFLPSSCLLNGIFLPINPHSFHVLSPLLFFLLLLCKFFGIFLCFFFLLPDIFFSQSYGFELNPSSSFFFFDI